MLENLKFRMQVLMKAKKVTKIRLNLSIKKVVFKLKIKVLLSYALIDKRNYHQKRHTDSDTGAIFKPNLDYSC